jgi:hypothetical protein
MTGLVTTGALGTGSIAAGFGAIDNGTSGITTGGNISIDVDADANDNTTDSAAGRLAIGASEDLNLFHNTHSYIVSKTGNLKFHVETDDKDIIFSGEDGASGITALTLDMSAAGTAEFNSNIYAGGGYMGLNTGDRIHFTDNTSAIIEVNGAEKLAVLANGDVDVESGDIFFSTAGKGIVLGATSNSADNTLDDFEKGTFNAFVQDASGNSEQYYEQNGQYNRGQYTKTGNIVHFTINFYTSGSSGVTGSEGARVIGLPFASSGSGSVGTNGFVTAPYMSGMASGVASILTGRIIDGQTYILLDKVDGNGNTSNMTVTEWSQARCTLAGFYRTG